MANRRPGRSSIGVGWGARMMETAGQGHNYRQLAEETGAVLQAAADALAALRSGAAQTAAVSGQPYEPYEPELPSDDADAPSAKVYFVEFPPGGGAAPAPADADPDGPAEIILSDQHGASLFSDEAERSEWAPPVELPTWWTRGGAQG